MAGSVPADAIQSGGVVATSTPKSMAVRSGPCRCDRPPGQQVAGGQAGCRRAGPAEGAGEVEAGAVVDGPDPAAGAQQVGVAGGAVHVLQEAVGKGDRVEHRGVDACEVGGAGGLGPGQDAMPRFQP